MNLKRFLSLVCCLSLTVAMLVPTAFAADNDPVVDTEKYDFIVDDIAYKKVDDSTVEVAVYQKVTPPTANNAGAFVSSMYDGKAISIPGTVTKDNTIYTVIGIGVDAFASAKPSSVTLPTNSSYFTYIGENAFNDCNLSSVTIPSSVTEIRSNAFIYGDFTSISFADDSSVVCIGDGAFAGCQNLSSLTLPQSVKTIGGSVFAGCTALSSVTIPSSVTNLDPGAFGAYGSIQTPYYGANHTINFADECKYKLQDGILYDDESLLNVYEVQASVTVPEGIKYIGEDAFKVMPANSTDSTLTSITFPSTLVSIGDDAFQRNTGLTTINIPSSLETLGTGVFSGCSDVTNVEISANLTEIPANTFSGTSISSITLPNTVTKIGESAFSKCNELTSIVIPDTVTEIGKSAFNECSKLTNIDLPENLETIGESAFFKCSALEAIEIPEGVSRIEQKTFGNCSALNTVILPSTVNYVGINAFGNALTGVDAVLVMKGSTPPTTFEAKAFGVKNNTPVFLNNLTVVVPAGSESSYSQDNTLKTYITTAGNDDETTKPGISYKLDINKTVSIVNGETSNLGTAIVPTGWKLIVEPSNNNVVTISDPDASTGAITVTANSVGNITVKFSIKSETSDIVLAEESCQITVTKKSSGNVSPSVPSYSIATPKVDNGTVTVSPAAAKKGATVTITVTPDEGYELASLTVTDAKGNALVLTDKGSGKYTFVMPASKVTIDAVFSKEQAPVPPTPVAHPFTDVADGAWYADAVQYVFEKGLMTGTGDTLFSPEETTSRAMIATILYRLEGAPAVSGSTAFTDVEAGQWYTDAITWAAQSGVVNGTTATTFAPNDPITREQMAAMLYRYAAYKGYDVESKADLSGYRDADQVSQYATEALQWANAAGLITGTSETTLSPTGSAVRAQVAAILMRFCENVVK